MSVRNTIESKLQEAFDPIHIEVVDESELHRGHAGYREGGETHFRVRLVSAVFAGMSRIDRHRQVNLVLADELEGSVHALALKLESPGEADG